jgi:hypothetical protein
MHFYYQVILHKLKACRHWETHGRVAELKAAFGFRAGPEHATPFLTSDAKRQHEEQKAGLDTNEHHAVKWMIDNIMRGMCWSADDDYYEEWWGAFMWVPNVRSSL